MSGGRTMYGEQHVSFDDYSSVGIASPTPQPTADGMVKAVLSPVDCESRLEDAMIRHNYNGRSKAGNEWMPGQNVKVGFLNLRVVGCRAVKDGLPDIYTLVSLDGSRHYEFIPHNGLTRIPEPSRMEQ